MKKEKGLICNHSWEDLYVFRTAEGKRQVQQRCRKCKANRYVDYQENDQNGSKKEENKK